MISLVNISGFLSLSLLFLMPLPDQPAGPGPDQGRYCNEQFRFCAEYPNSTLSVREDFNNGDGILLYTEDRAGQVIIAGFREPEPRSAREVFQASIEQLKQPGEKDFIISSIFGEDFYECYFIINKKSYYQKAYLFNGYFVRESVSVPINRPDLLPILKQQITLDFHSLSSVDIPAGVIADQH